MQPAIGGLTPTSISRDRTLLSGVEQAARPMPSISTGARATAVGFIGGHTLSSASWTSKAERQANERPARKDVGSGQSGTVRGDHGGCRDSKKKKKRTVLIIKGQ